MCVKTKQLDMAMLCLGHMKQARSARALREAVKDDSLSLEAKIGILAVELELYVSPDFNVDIFYLILGAGGKPPVRFACRPPSRRKLLS